MSVRALAWAFEVEVKTPSLRCVLLALADHADDNGRCWPSHKTLAKRSCQSISTVQRRLKQLVYRGYLTVESRKEFGKTCMYQIAWKKGVGQVDRSILDEGGRSDNDRPVGQSYDVPGRSLLTDKPSMNRQEPSLFRSIEKEGEGKRTSDEKDFEEFWQSYPRKVAKLAAKKAFLKAIKLSSLQAMLAALAIDKGKWTEERFTPHPATWLNGGCYLDRAETKPIRTTRPPGWTDDDERRMEEKGSGYATRFKQLLDAGAGTPAEIERRMGSH